MYQDAFSFFTGSNQGTSETSHAWTSDAATSRAFGQAELQVALNVSNGNLCVRDHHKTIDVPGFQIPVGFCLNNKCLNPSNNEYQAQWRNAAQISLSNSQINQGKLIITGGDGHEVTYTHDQQSGTYIANGLVGGDAVLTVNNNGTYTRTQYGSHITQTFNAHGQLTEQRDSHGNTLTYTYDNGQLSRITSSSGQAVVFDRQANNNNIDVIISLSEPSQHELNAPHIRGESKEEALHAHLRLVQSTPLMTCTFNASDMLTNTAIAVDDNTTYGVSYHYDTNPTCLSNITQTDGTSLLLLADSVNRITDVYHDNTCVSHIDYADVGTSTVTNALGAVTKFDFDDQRRLTQLVKPNGNTPSVFVYTYDDDGRLQTRQRFSTMGTPINSRDYNDHGVLQRTVDGLGQATDILTDANGDVIARTRYPSNSQSLTTYTVRDPNTRQVLFTVSPSGIVTEYSYNATGFRTARRRYLAARFPLSQQTESKHEQKQPNTVTPISLEALQKWVSGQPKDHVQLQTYQPNFRQQRQGTTTFAQVDGNGNGIANAQMAQHTTTFDAFGQALQQHTRLVADNNQQHTNADVYATITQRFDGLQRRTYHQDAEHNTTTHTYQDTQQQVITTHPNQRQDTRHWDTRGFTDWQTQTGEINATQPEHKEQKYEHKTDSITTATLRTTYVRDAQGRAYQTQHSNGTTTQTQFDEQNREVLAIDPRGYATGTHYSDESHVLTVTEYAQAQPNEQKEQKEQKKHLYDNNHPQNRVRATLYDNAGNLRYEIDGERYATLNVYDAANRRVQRIRFATPVPANQALALDSDGVIPGFTEQEMTEQDSVTLYTLDADDHVHFQQTANNPTQGYVVEYKHDNAGNAIHTVQYADAVALSLTPTPTPSDDDAHTYDYYDGCNQHVGQVDAEQYVTQNTYYAGGKLQQRLRYANTTTANLNTATSINQVLPTTNPEDHRDSYAYNANQQVTSHSTSYGYRQTMAYNSMGQRTDHTEHDLRDADNSNDRHTHTQYNAFGHVVLRANPRVMARHPNDWQQYATQDVYDANTGLRIQSIEPPQQPGGSPRTTYYYYNHNQQLALTVSPEGRLQEHTYFAFADEVIQTRRYQQRWNTQQQPLIGGYLTQTLRDQLTALQNDTLDAVTIDVYNQNGQHIQHTDPRGFVTTWQWNAHGQCQQEINELDKGQRRVTENSYTRRGLLQARTQQQLEEKMVTPTYTTTYQRNFQGKATLKTDANNGQHKYSYDKLARQTRYQDPDLSEQKAAQAAWQTAWDAFNRETKHVTPVGETTIIEHDQEQRTTTTVSSLGKTTVDTHNAFAEVVDHEDGLGNHTTKTYDHGGSCTSILDPLQRKTQYAYNDDGKKIWHTTPLGLDTDFSFTDDGLPETTVIDPNGEYKRTIQLQHDGRGYTSQRTNASGTVTDMVRDQAGYLQLSVFDPQSETHPDGLHILTFAEHNANGQDTLTVTGDLQELDQRHIRTMYDVLGRVTAVMVDPDGLAIYRSRHTYLGNTKHPLTSMDANGNVTRHVYDASARLRFSIKPHGTDAEHPQGAVTETTYDDAGRVTQTRTYHMVLTAEQVASLHASTTPQQLAQLVTPNALDSVQYRFYDHDGDLVYEVDSLGRITQYLHDANRRPIGQIRYYNTLPSGVNVAALSTAELAAAVVADTAHDRHAYRLLDAAGQCRYQLSQVYDANDAQIKWKVIGRTYNKDGHVTSMTQYATTLLVLPAMPFDVNTVIVPRSSADRDVHFVYDRLGNKRFMLTPSDGAMYYVTAYTYDNEDRLQDTATFATAIALPDTLTVAAVQVAIQPNPAKDVLSSVTLDAAGRKQQVTDSQSRSDHYTYNACHNMLTHTDATGKTWEEKYDKAGRNTDSVTPAREVTTPVLDAKGHPVIDDTSGRIETKTQTRQIVKHREHDPVGNVIEITEDAESKSAARSMQFAYTLGHQLATTQQTAMVDDAKTEQVTVASPSNMADNLAQDRPEIKAIIQTHKQYNTHGKVIAEQDAAGYWSSRSLDSEQREIKRVDADGAVTQYDLDTFDQCIQQTAYANKTAVTSPLDRVTTYEYDIAGRRTLITLPPRFMYIANDNTASNYGVASPQVAFVSNIFGEEIQRRHLDNPFAATPVWSVVYSCRSRRGLVQARIDQLGHLTVQAYDHQRKQLYKMEYAMPLPNTVNRGTASLQTLLTAVTSSDTDREYMDEYDNCGQHIRHVEPYEHSQMGVLTETKSQQSQATLQSKTTRLMTTFIYTARKQVAQETHSVLFFEENQRVPTLVDVGCKYFFYDAGKQLIAKTDIARTLQYGSDEQVTPVHLMQRNGHGQVVLLRQCENAEDFSPTQPPNPAESKTDKIEIAVHNERGLLAWTQLANQTCRQQTFTAARQPARSWQFDWNNIIPKITGEYKSVKPPQIIMVRQVATTYGPHQKPVRRTRIDYTGQIFDNETEYNVFKETTAQGRGARDYTVTNHQTPPRSVIIHRDNNGTAWLSNRKKQWMVRLDDASGHEAARLQSSSTDLATLTPADLPQLLQKDYTQVQKTEIVRDAVGHEVARRKPAYQDQATTPLQAEFTVGNSYPDFGVYSLTWPLDAHIDMLPVLTVWPKGNDSNKTTLTIKTVKQRWGADISQLSAGNYDYHLAYYALTDGAAQSELPVREAFGSVALDTGNTAESKETIFLQQSHTELLITGNTDNVMGVQPFKDGKPVLDKNQQPIYLGATTVGEGRLYVDCSNVGLSNGVYTFVPVLGGKRIGQPVKPNSSGASVTLYDLPGQTITKVDDNQISWDELPLWGTSSDQSINNVHVEFRFAYKTNSMKKNQWAHYTNTKDMHRQVGSAGTATAPTLPSSWTEHSLIGAKVYIIEQTDNGPQYWLYGVTGGDWQPSAAAIVSQVVMASPMPANQQVQAWVATTTTGEVVHVQTREWLNGYRIASMPALLRSNNAYQTASYQAMSLDNAPLAATESPPFTLYTEQNSTTLMAQPISVDVSMFALNPQTESDVVIEEIKTEHKAAALEYKTTTPQQPPFIDYTLSSTFNQAPLRVRYWNGKSASGEITKALTSYVDRAEQFLNQTDSGALHRVVVEARSDDGFWIPLLNQPPVSREIYKPWGNVSYYYFDKPQVLYFTQLPATTYTVEFDILQLSTTPSKPVWMYEAGTLLESEQKSVTYKAFAAAINLGPGQYTYRIRLHDSQSRVIRSQALGQQDEEGYVTGVVEIKSPGAQFVTTPTPATPPLIQPLQRRSPDRWGLTQTFTDESGFKTSYRYNSRGKVRLVMPPAITYRNPNGEISVVQTQRVVAFNPQYHFIGYQLPMGNVYLSMVNQVGQPLAYIEGQGIQYRKGLDGFGRVTQLNVTGKDPFLFEHAPDDTITTVTTPAMEKGDSSHVITLTYNGSGHRLSRSRAVVEVYQHQPVTLIDYYQPNMSGGLLAEQNAYGSVRFTQLDRNNAPVTLTLATGKHMTWQRDPWFSIEEQHTDLGGATVITTRNANQQVIMIQGSGGDHGQVYGVYGNLIPTPGRNEVMLHDEAGHHVATRNIADGKYSVMGYAADGDFHYRCTVTLKEGLVQEVSTTRDPWKRLRAVNDLQARLVYGYDLNDNVTRRNINAYNAETQSVVPRAYGSTFDPQTDAVLILNGQYEKPTTTHPNGVVVTETTGVEFTYDPQTCLRNSFYAFIRQGDWTRTTLTFYNNLAPATRPITSGQWDPSYWHWNADMQCLRYQRDTIHRVIYNNGVYTHDEVDDTEGHRISDEQINRLDASGHSLQKRDRNYGDNHPSSTPIYTDELTQFYVGFNNEWRLIQSSGTRSGQGYNYNTHSVFITFNSKGNALTVEGSATDGYRWFVSDGAGNMLRRYSELHQEMYNSLRTPSGDLLLEYGVMSMGNVRTIYPNGYVPYLFDIRANTVARIMSSQFPWQSPQTYRSETGKESIARVAQSVYKRRHPMVAELLAYCNGLTSVKDKTPSQYPILLLPQLAIGNKDQAGLVPSDNLADWVSSIYPKLPIKPIIEAYDRKLRAQQHHNFWDEVLEVAVGVIVTAVLSEVLPGLLGSLGMPQLLMAAIEGSLEQGISNLAQQATAVLLGQQSEIDMDAVGEAFLQGAEAGVANDIAQVSPTGKGSLADSKNVVWSLKKAGEVAALQQGMMLLTGQQKHFSWKEMALAEINAAANGVINSSGITGEPGHRDFLQTLEYSTLNETVGEVATALVMDEHVRVEAIAANALGVTLGQVVSSSIHIHIGDSHSHKQQANYDHHHHLQPSHYEQALQGLQKWDKLANEAMNDPFAFAKPQYEAKMNAALGDEAGLSSTAKENSYLNEANAKLHTIVPTSQSGKQRGAVIDHGHRVAANQAHTHKAIETFETKQISGRTGQGGNNMSVQGKAAARQWLSAVASQLPNGHGVCMLMPNGKVVFAGKAAGSALLPTQTLAVGTVGSSGDAVAGTLPVFMRGAQGLGLDLTSDASVMGGSVASGITLMLWSPSVGNGTLLPAEDRVYMPIVPTLPNTPGRPDHSDLVKLLPLAHPIHPTSRHRLTTFPAAQHVLPTTTTLPMHENKATIFVTPVHHQGVVVYYRKDDWGKYRPPYGLPANKDGAKLANSELPHSQIGTSRKGTYTKARTWNYDANGKLSPEKEIDFTDHGRPLNHENPHQHVFKPNSTGGTLERGVSEPLKVSVVDAVEDFLKLVF